MTSNATKKASAKRKVWIYSAIGVVALLVLLATLAIAGQEHTLRCDRLSDGKANCVITKSILGVITLKSQATTGARGISIGQQCAGSNCKFRLELYTDQGTVPVNDSYSSNYNQLLEAFTRFNTFFTNTSNTNMELSEATNPSLIIGTVAVCVLIWIYLGILSWQAKRASE